MSPSPSKGPDLRVLMTADAVGGVWQYALDLAEGLRPFGVEVVLAVLGPPPSCDQVAMAEFAGVRLITTDLSLDWTANNPGEIERASHSIACLADEIGPDLVHLNSPALAAHAAFGCPVVAVCHSCVATWWKAMRGGALPDEFVWRTDLVRKGYQNADLLLAPTTAFAQSTAEVYGLSKAPLVVRNGRRVRTTSKSGESELFAFTAGRLWDEGKGFAVIDRAAARLSIPLLAAGPLQGPNGAQVRSHNVTSLGRLSDVDIEQHFASRPIFVSAARYEPFGLAVLEAAQAGCALVLSDIPTFRELWDGAAIFVAPDDEAAIAHAIEHLAQGPGKRRDMGAAANMRAANYSLEAMSNGVFSAYRSLLPSKLSSLSPEGAAA